jgi:hypothetical protein
LPVPPWNALFSSGRLMMSSRMSFCQIATPKQTPNATMQMMSRVRSSSRCSTRLRRSSWATGLSFVAIAGAARRPG